MFDIDTQKKQEIDKVNNWQIIDVWEQESTITIVSNKNKYATSKSSKINIDLQIKTATDDEKITWYEDWGTFTTNKVELIEVLKEAINQKQIKIKEIMGAT